MPKKPVSIIEKLRAKQQALLEERTENRKLRKSLLANGQRPGKAINRLARRNANMAIDAIEGGLGSPAWEKYMKQFATTPDQLARLTDPDKKLTKELKHKRAYIVANAVCGAPTVTGLTEDVFSIDAGLPGGCEGEDTPLECDNGRAEDE